MANFDKYAPKLKKWEGSAFVNDADDAGGPTNSGVTLDTLRMHYGPTKTVNDLRAMTQQQWTAIMKGNFWDKCWGDMIKNQSVAEIFVDWCINSGIGMIKKVQGIVGTKADGVLGPQTLAAINKYDQRRLHFAIKSARAAYYEDCVKNRSANLKFYDGWMNRLCSFQYSDK